MKNTEFKLIKTDYKFLGSHVYADIYNLTHSEVTNQKLLQYMLEEAINRSGAQICGSISKMFDPHGFTCLYLLAESHASIHTYPEKNAIFFDAFTCGSPDPKVILNHFISVFSNPKVMSGFIGRGEIVQENSKNVNEVIDLLSIS